MDMDIEFIGYVIKLGKVYFNVKDIFGNTEDSV